MNTLHDVDSYGLKISNKRDSETAFFIIFCAVSERGKCNYETLKNKEQKTFANSAYTGHGGAGISLIGVSLQCGKFRG